MEFLNLSLWVLQSASVANSKSFLISGPVISLKGAGIELRAHADIFLEGGFLLFLRAQDSTVSLKQVEKL